MLQKLTINNYALIDNLEIGFDKGLNILTGETGAGKSIILGALSLILGQRAESKYFFNQQKKCVIEGLFKIENLHLKSFFEENDLDYEVNTVLRREITIDGKSRAFINDTPVNLNTIKQLGEQLIDIHSQHATLEINNPTFQLLVIDAIAQHGHLLNTYHEKFKAYQELIDRLDRLKEENEKAKTDLDYYQFQYDELENAAIVPDEQETLEQELYALNNAEDIKRNLLTAQSLIESNENAALQLLKEASQQLSALEKFNPEISELGQRLNSAIIELKDIAAEVEQIEQKTYTDEQRADEINTRLSIIYNLQKKHRVGTNAELLQLQQELSDKIQQATFGDETIAKLEKELQEAKAELKEIALTLSANRAKTIPTIETQVVNTLAEMGMASSVLKIELKPTSELTKNGIDSVRLLFSANKGHAPAEMSKIASGGELSRLMLSIKSIIAKYTALPSIIFDEIDTGVSGEVANKVGQIMEQLTHNLQVITITHLPQIAAKGQTHFFVYKDDSNAITYTRIKQLSNEERVTEIAKMLSGNAPGESAILNAKELLNN